MRQAPRDGAGGCRVIDLVAGKLTGFIGPVTQLDRRSSVWVICREAADVVAFNTGLKFGVVFWPTLLAVIILVIIPSDKVLHDLNIMEAIYGILLYTFIFFLCSSILASWIILIIGRPVAFISIICGIGGYFYSVVLGVLLGAAIAYFSIPEGSLKIHAVAIVVFYSATYAFLYWRAIQRLTLTAR